MLALAVASAACRPEPPSGLRLTLRQVLTGGSIEVAVGPQRLTMTIKPRNGRTEKRELPLSEAESEELRRLFWRAWRSQPETRDVTRIAGDAAMEYAWEGPERSWRVSIRGALTQEERTAFARINALLPDPYKFPIDFGFFRRSTEDS